MTHISLISGHVVLHFRNQNTSRKSNEGNLVQLSVCLNLSQNKEKLALAGHRWFRTLFPSWSSAKRYWGTEYLQHPEFAIATKCLSCTYRSKTLHYAAVENLDYRKHSAENVDYTERQSLHFLSFELVFFTGWKLLKKLPFEIFSWQF